MWYRLLFLIIYTLIFSVLMYTGKQVWDLRVNNPQIVAQTRSLQKKIHYNLSPPIRESVTFNYGDLSYHLNLSTFQSEFPYLQSYHCSFILAPKAETEETNNPLLILAIKSHPGSGYKRAALRQTWARKRVIDEYNIKPIFLVGKTVVSGHMEIVNVENQVFNDILQFDFYEGHHNLSLKENCFLEWLHYQMPNVAFVFKGDDDEYVNPDRLVKYIKEHGSSPSILHGSVRKNSVVLHKGKYCVSKTLFPYKKYPIFLSGGGFLFPGSTVKPLYEASQKLPVFPLDDVYFGFLVLASNLSFRHDDRFYVWGLEYTPCKYRNALVVHGIEQEWLIQIWQEIQSAQC